MASTSIMPPASRTVETPSLTPETPVAEAEIAPALPEPPVQAVATELGGVATDMGRLVELQIQLFETECRQSAKMLVRPLILLSASGMLALVTMIGLLFSLASAFQEAFQWAPSVALLAASVVTALIATAMVATAWSLLQTSRISFAKSKEELMRNAACLAQLLKSQPR